MSNKLLYLLLLITIYISNKHCAIFDKPLRVKWNESRLCPDVLNQPPSKICRVVWDWGEVHPTRVVRTASVVKEPKVEWLGLHRVMHTIYMVGLSEDPPNDTFQPRNLTQYANWIIINIPGMNVPLGDVIAPYVSPPPPSHPNGQNVYGLFIYKQAGYIPLPTPNRTLSDKQRSMKLQDFADSHGLLRPTFGNFFYVKWD